MLKIDNLRSRYGHIEALHGISLEVGECEIVALIGANGAGKTTLLNTISGHVQATGSITYNGIELISRKPHDIARAGVLQVPEGRHVFPGLTVEQNLATGTVVWGRVRIRQGNIDEDLESVYGFFPRLKERRRQLAWSLSGGEQQMLAIGRALMGRPKMLMLDEPSMGLAPRVIEDVFRRIVDINKSGIPVLLVEQNASIALSVSKRAYVIERGLIILDGDSREIAGDERVKAAYLGQRKLKDEKEKS